MTPTIKIKGDEVSIFIDSILHLKIRDRITLIQSWKHENSWYKIEIQTKNNTTTLEYDSLDKWKEILKLLEDI